MKCEASGNNENKDIQVIKAFGEEWSRFDQEELKLLERLKIFNDYFSIFPWDNLPKEAKVADIGCGSGRWAAVVAPRVARLICVDASSAALNVAKHNLKDYQNVEFLCADLGDLPFSDDYIDFAYSLGVLHHVPDTELAIANISRIIKPGGLFLVYLYYAFDNRPFWFRMLWKTSDVVRQGICRLPTKFRFAICDMIAAFIYFPLARMASLLRGMNLQVRNFPLYYYWDKSFYVMRTDALDRFGTRLEHRFSRNQITEMLHKAGFHEVSFSNGEPFWCAVARKR